MQQYFEKKIERSSEPNPLTTDNIVSGFYLLLIGQSISVVVFVIEMCVQKFKILKINLGKII